MSRVSATLLLCLACWSLPAVSLELTAEEQAWLAAHPELSLGVDHNWPPYEFIDDNERYQGLADYRTDYIRQTQQRGAEGVQSRQFNQYLNFITKLDQALEQQNLQIQQAQRVVDMRRTAWLTMQKKRKAIELLIDKELAASQQRQNKLEQKLLDEIATQQFFRRLQQTGV